MQVVPRVLPGALPRALPGVVSRVALVAVTLAAVVVLLTLLTGCMAPTAPEPDGDPGAAVGDPGAGVGDPGDAVPRVPALDPEIDTWDASVVTITTITGGAVRVDVRVADSVERRRRGLMHVSEVPAGAGMLFVFPEDTTGGFWMLDTLIPLDIAFIAADGEVLALATMQPCETDPCPITDPGVTYRTALEVPAGFLAERGIAIGDRLTFTPPQPAVPIDPTASPEQ